MNPIAKLRSLELDRMIRSIHLVKLRSLELDRMIHSIHFWIIITLMLALTLVYYTFKDWFPWFFSFFVFEYKNDIVGSLFLIPFIYASLVFWWRGSLIVWLLSAAAMLPCVMYYSFSLEKLMINVVLSLVPLMIVIIIALEQKWRETQKRILAEREEERQIYMSQIFKTQENERQRIAQELHDGTMQELLVIANRAQVLVSGDGNETTVEKRERAEWVRDAILQVLEDVRRLSLDLRPSVLDDIGLVPALRWLTDHLDQDGGINTQVVVHGAERKLSSETEVTIFRIVQEALNNARRHSKATEAVVTLEFAPESLEITVQDNGDGFSLRETSGKLATEGKLGLIGMQQRAKFLNSTFNIYSQPGKGTLVSIEIAD